MGILGSRGLRSHSVPARPVPRRPQPASLPASAPRAPRAPPAPPAPPAWRAVEGWLGPLAGVAAGWLIATALVGAFGREGTGPALLPQSLLGGAIFVFVMLLRRYRLTRPARGAVTVPPQVVDPPAPATTGDHPGASILDAGIQDVRRMDAKFDPTRFTGYVETVFRATQHARAKGDVEAVRDRVTPELYGELRAQTERLSALGQASRVDQIDIRAEVTEAWHEDGRDYVTAYIAGSMRDDVVDASTGALVDGPETGPKNVDAFYTFTRPAGLHPWMLSAIQTSDGMPALPS